MRRALVLLVATGLLTGLAMPASAAKKKIHETFTAQALPFPKLGAMDPTGTMPPGCRAGVEDVNWVAHPFETPGAGKLTYYIEDFLGDWDIYVLDAEGMQLGSSDAAQVQDMAPAEEKIELELKKGQQVILVVCNWASPQVEIEAHYKYVYEVPKKAKGGGGGHHH